MAVGSLKHMGWLIVAALLAGEPAVAKDVVDVTHVSLPGVSSRQWESHPAVDPANGDLWFVRSDKNFQGWRILTSQCHDGRWSDPKPMPFAGAGLEADPWFSLDGRTLWFISSRATGAMASAGLDIWRAQRNGRGAWRAPERLPAPVNSDATEWFPRPAADGWLYFGSRRAGGFGKDDIWRARQDADGSWQVENAGAGLNTADAEYELQTSPDGRWGVLSTDKGLFYVEPGPKGWHRTKRLDASVNVNGTEIGPMITPDSCGFVFSRDAGGDASGEFFLAKLDASAKWPGACGKTKPR
jgi:hypothetical protein